MTKASFVLVAAAAAAAAAVLIVYLSIDVTDRQTNERQARSIGSFPRKSIASASTFL
jgi:hypothetical protein